MRSLLLRGRLKRVSCNERIGFSTPPFNERIRVSESGRDFSNVLLAKKAHYVLDNDFLSPLLSAGLFPDFVQRFLPAIPILSDGVDRARGLEPTFRSSEQKKR